MVVVEQLDPKIPKILITGDLQVDTKYPFAKILQKPFHSESVDKILRTYQKKPKN